VNQPWGNSTFRVLADPDVRGMALARFAALLGSSLVPTALAFGVLQLPDGSAAALGLVMAVATLGQVVFVLPGGVISDRWPRKRVMIAAEVVAGASLIGCGVLLSTGQATVVSLAALAAFSGMATGLFYPAATGFVPEISPPADLQSTNAFLKMAANLARIAGTAASGIIVALAGSGPALIGGGILAVTAALLIARLHPRFAVPDAPSGSPFADFAEGWREFTARRWVVVIVVLGAISSFGFSAWLGVLGPLQASESGGVAQWAFISTAMAIGALLGVLVALRIRSRRPLSVAVIALGLLSLPVLAAAAGTPIAVVVVAAFVAGVAVDLFAVLWETSLQQRVPQEALSRVSAFDWLGTFAMAPVALAVAGPLVDAYGLTPVLWGAAALIATAPLALLEPQVRARVNAAFGQS
jgi:MFS family permease